MGKSRAITAVGSLIVAGAVCCAAGAAQAASLEVGSVTGTAGSQVTFNVTLHTAGASVAGTQNDITFDATNAPIGMAASGAGTCSTTTANGCLNDSDCPTGETCARAQGPDCTVGSGINKEAIFAFVGTGTLRAIVAGISPPNTDAIADGATLYSCKATIATGAANGTMFALAVPAASVGISDPNGNAVTPATATDGQITVGTPSACCGDSNGNNSISTSEATNAVLALINRDVTKNPAADCNDHNGQVSTSEATKVILNLVNRTCN